MPSLEILFLAFSLSMDAFAISIVMSFSKETNTRKAAFACFSFGVFQLLFFLLGAFLGKSAGHFIDVAGVWVAFALLMAVGLKMIKDGFSSSEGEFKKSGSFILSVLLLSVADSIDSAAAGMGMAFSEVGNTIPDSICIGITTLIISALGFVFGKKLGGKFGEKAEIFGGFVLIAIAVKILVS